MSRNNELVKVIRNFYQKLRSYSPTTLQEQRLWLLRTFLVNKRKPEWSNAGFLLPTVAMVSLVVVLLTIAILFRSFERSKNASNVRVDQVILNATAPAIDRVKAKLNALSEDPTLPRGTPSDGALYDALKKDKYRLGDESRLKLAYDFNGQAGIQEGGNSIEENEASKTAWKFAIDTDNNGLKDTYTLYGVYFRSPSRDSNTGEFARKRNPLEARTPPMDNDATNQVCRNAAGFSTLVGNSSWYKLQNGNLGKSFFTYAVNVPITDAAYNQIPAAEKSQYEKYKGNKGFAALEFQQDRSRIPLPNNAVWFENDLEISSGTDLAINGRVHTNGNFLVGSGSADNTFRQVSSKSSCFFNQENGLMTVGGNVGTGSVSTNTDQSNQGVVHLYQGFNQNVDLTKKINSSNKSTDKGGGSLIGFNDNAYSQRIARMKTRAEELCTTCFSATTGAALETAVNANTNYPQEIKQNVSEKVAATDDNKTATDILKDEIEIYLRNRTRRVPFAEVGQGATKADAEAGFAQAAFDVKLDPPADWREPITSGKLTGTSGTDAVSVNTSNLSATFPDLQKQEGIQTEIGDRVFVGNNLPARWLKGTNYVGAEENQLIASVNWNRPTTGAKQRWRNSQIQPLADLGITDRNGFWEEKAYEQPRNALDNVGGVRIITGAGIYRDDDWDPTTGIPPTKGTPNYSRTAPVAPTPPALLTSRNLAHSPNAVDTAANIPKFNSLDNIYVWSDTMRMSSANPANTGTGDLLMRATAVYHYKINSTAGVAQEPLACVSSYHDPSYRILNDTNGNGVWDSGETYTDSRSNRSDITGLPALPTGVLPANTATTGGKSNNGVVYTYPGRTTFNATNRALLERQARLVYPNGRVVNQPLRDALSKFSGTTIPTTLQASDYSAIDTALCAVSILNNPTSNIVAAGTANMPPHGAIREASFLDGREAKQVARLGLNFAALGNQNDLDLEQRQPLEIRTTDIDLGQLANTVVSTTEYLLPNSGIIYASRDDAMRDASDNSAQSEILSPTDFKLDPTRRPNGVRLINGGTLARRPATNNNAYTPQEKGLILATNLPAYIRGAFNLHRTSTTGTTEIEEFTETTATTDFYGRSTPNTSFACRGGRTGCPATGGDYWRPATLIADSMTLLSGSFLDGTRSEGDFDINNNTGVPVPDLNLGATSGNAIIPVNGTTLDPITRSRLQNGFLENGFVTNTNWWGTLGVPRNTNNTPTGTEQLGSYALNGVTPIQRRANGVPLYVMEMCRKEDVSDCLPNDWVVGFDINGNGILDNAAERNVKANEIGIVVTTIGGSISGDWNTTFVGTPLPLQPAKSIRQRLGAGDTANLALTQGDQRFPRRVAFARDNNNQLVVASLTSPYQPIGVGCPVRSTAYTTPAVAAEYQTNGCSYATSPAAATNYGVTGNNGLWFRTVNGVNPSDIAQATYNNNQSLFYYPPADLDINGDGTIQPTEVGAIDINRDGTIQPTEERTGQPILVPVTQVNDANSLPPGGLRTDGAAQNQFRDNWLNAANGNTTYNATFVVGNSPSRPAEVSAGLQNFVRFSESWNGINARISGSFIQMQRSKFATAPLSTVLSDRVAATATNASGINDNRSIFDYPLDTYPIGNSNGLLPFYWAPTRTWGFDVGLLSEQPDLFAQRFTQPQTGRPSEFFREVGRDDLWVQSLLCAAVASDKKGNPGATYTNEAVPSGDGYRPNNCPTAIPSDPS
ncbi:hormogonium polysaccharide biosynthesis protein HpsA [Brunnivagina elsteri]|uniref:Uncharacterized protein n=1 Tax=Brunnivagina elsteri CCALA 953 TaxID=987040 RepID=A0A2A2TQH5_9CYAN|nr:hormogonium polysaccharide biosynthesis protein HpsA [Calothrix elsteri]PAX60667.1 hypothetical protein CK510_00650 [Calothrix elsteri CCALA 953]